MKHYEAFNDILVKLFNDIMNIEGKVVITEEFSDITNNDMHIIEAIGNGESKMMTTIAKALNVTCGTLTIGINSLVKKGYVQKIRGERDKRVVYISLLEKGVNAYNHHEKFHQDMIEAVIKELKEDEIKAIVKALKNLNDFFIDKRDE